MKLTSAVKILTAAAFVTTAAAASNNITYNVISLVQSNQTMGVLVDDQVYPLTSVSDDSTLLHTGEAPLSSSGYYRYALILKDDYSIAESENFTRTNNGSSDSTLNEYYGRSWNSWALDELPTILPPLPIIDRIESDLHIDGEIPTIHIIGNQTEIDTMHANQSEDVDIYLNMTYISPNDVKSFHNISIAVSGHSTRSYAKLSYKLKISKDDDDDLYGYRQLKLRSMATDASYMREELAYGIAESIGLPTSRYSYVRVYINNQAIGLFGFAEVLKNPWIRNEFADGSKMYTQGALFVADVSGGQTMTNGNGNAAQQNSNSTAAAGGNQTPPSQQNQTAAAIGVGGQEAGGNQADSIRGSTSDLSYLGSNVTLYSAGQYSLKEDPSTGSANYTRIMDLTKFISGQPNTTTVDDSAVSLWQEKMDTDSFLRGLVFEIVISNSDGYFTMANNYILYDDLDQERLVFSGQDFDLSMGTSMYNTTLMNGGNYTEYPGFTTRPLMTRMLQVPQFKQDFENLIVNITKQLVNLDILETRIDQIAAMITEDVAWDKTCTRVGSSTGSSMGGNGAGGGNTTNNSTASAAGGATGGMSSSSSSVDFTTAVNGPTNSSTSMAVKEWLSTRSNNTLSFFDQ